MNPRTFFFCDHLQAPLTGETKQDLPIPTSSTFLMSTGVFPIKPGPNSIVNGMREAKKKGINHLYLQKGVHTVTAQTFPHGDYVHLTEEWTITGAGRGLTIVTGFGFYVTGRKDDQVTLKDMTVNQTIGPGFNGYEGMSFLCERMHFDQCGREGVIANETNGRLVNCVITQCGLSGIYSYDKGLVFVEGDETKIDKNVATGLLNRYGLEAEKSSKIQLLAPLTKESITTVDNLGGGNWGTCDGGLIEQVAYRTVREGYIKTYARSFLGEKMHKKNRRYFALQSCGVLQGGVLQYWLDKKKKESGRKPRKEMFLPFTGGGRDDGTADNGTKILPVDRNYKGLELELRGFRDCALKNRMEIVLIAESREDRVGWFDAIQQVIKKEE